MSDTIVVRNAALRRAILDALREGTRAEALPFDRFAQLSILMEEVGEAAQAINDHRWKGPCIERIRGELLQVASVSLRMVAHLESSFIHPTNG